MRTLNGNTVTWWKSSYSSSQANCVEVAELPGTAWAKSSYSTSQANCVEVAAGYPVVGVRDSKNVPGPSLAFGPDAWTAFLATLH